MTKLSQLCEVLSQTCGHAFNVITLMLSSCYQIGLTSGTCDLRKRSWPTFKSLTYNISFQRCTLSLVKVLVHSNERSIFLWCSECAENMCVPAPPASHSILSFTLSYTWSCTDTCHTFIQTYSPKPHLSDLTFSQQRSPAPSSPCSLTMNVKSQQVPPGNFVPDTLMNSSSSD